MPIEKSNSFEFLLLDPVTIKSTGMHGVVIGRADHVANPSKYLVRENDPFQRNQPPLYQPEYWLSADALELHQVKGDTRCP